MKVNVTKAKIMPLRTRKGSRNVHLQDLHALFTFGESRLLLVVGLVCVFFGVGCNFT